MPARRVAISVVFSPFGLVYDPIPQENLACHCFLGLVAMAASYVHRSFAAVVSASFHLFSDVLLRFPYEIYKSADADNEFFAT